VNSGEVQEPAREEVSTGTDAAADVLARAHAWLAQDPDGETRAELRALIEAAESGNPAAVEDPRIASPDASPSEPPDCAAPSGPAATA
jgi:hypothetical protein